MGLLDYLFGPLVTALVTLTERFTYSGSVLAFLCIIETISKTIQVLSLNHNFNRVCALSWAPEGVVFWQIGLTFLETRVYQNLPWLQVVCLSVLTDMRGSAEVASSLVAV